MGIGDFRHVGTVQTVTVISDGGGGTVEAWVDSPPAWPIDIRPATVRDLERQTAGTTVATATHVIHGRDRGDVTVTSRIVAVIEGQTRIFLITGLARPRERPIDLLLFAKETI
jgi:head-tail adaptor